ncbi:DNA polymerase III subunit chi [Francisella sp. LA112445]|uniref:DNA polymerase III subunit chi n=1 Tax=Francisella sp. LA112445 TaxID=1395624 RepID=UPI001788BF69|nr:DNA polymerase III subunit chi [Francisella sp. LA112445]QIW09339.1 DNA polymerase III subunit chi [Francisella sp. LA112445]
MQVEFHVLQTSEQKELLDSIVNYVLDNYKNKTFAILAPTGIAKELDEKLWQPGGESFIPHHCAISAREYNQYKNIPILITDNLFITSGFDVLINIMDVAVDPQRIKIKELKEFVYQQEQALLASRKKYMYYKSSNLEINTIKE